MPSTKIVSRLRAFALLSALVGGLLLPSAGHPLTGGGSVNPPVDSPLPGPGDTTADTTVIDSGGTPQSLSQFLQ